MVVLSIMPTHRFKLSRFAKNSHRRRAAAGSTTPYDRIPEQAPDEAPDEQSMQSLDDQPQASVFPPVWYEKKIEAIYVSKIRKGPASFFILNFRKGFYAPATMEKLAFDFDLDPTLLDQMTPITKGMTMFPVLELRVQVPKNKAARDAAQDVLMDGRAIVTEVVAQVGSATKAALKVMEMETDYPVLNDDE